MFRNYFHITFTAERQPHHWDTAGQPIQGCAAKQGTKGTESPAGMWNGLDSTSLIIAWPGYQCWCHATHTCQNKCLRLYWPKGGAWGGTNPQMLSRILQVWRRMGFCSSFVIQLGYFSFARRVIQKLFGKTHLLLRSPQIPAHPCWTFSETGSCGRHK